MLLQLLGSGGSSNSQQCSGYMNVLIIFDIWRFIKLLPALTRYVKVLVIKLYLKQVFQILKFTDKFLEKVNQ